jgi:hypothetical protein
MHLDALLATSRWPAGWSRVWASAPAGPDRHRLSDRDLPGLLDELNRLAFAYRWTTRAICLDKTDATGLLGKIRRQWFAKRKSVLACCARP